MSNQDPVNIRRKSRRILRELEKQAGRSDALGPGGEPWAQNHGKSGLILIEGGGRPYFAERPADFSVSHSKRAAAVSYLGFPSLGRRLRTGCDIQYQQPKRAYRELAAHFFHPPEQEFLAAAETEAEGLRAFYLLWVLKEAYLKIRGLSVFDLCRCPVFSFENRAGEAEGTYFFPEDPGDATDLDFFLYELRDPAGDAYSLAVCRERDGLGAGPSAEPGFNRWAEPVVRWFSQEKSPLKSIAKIKAAERPINTVRPKI